MAANAASLGAHAVRAASVGELGKALTAARAATQTTVIQVETDPSVPAPGSDAWWDVPVAQVSELPATRAARTAYVAAKRRQRPRYRPSRPL